MNHGVNRPRIARAMCRAMALLALGLAPATHAQIVRTAPVQVNDYAAQDTTGEYAYQTELAAGSDEVWVAVHHSNKAATGAADYDIYFTRSTDRGLTWSAPAFLNTNAATDGANNDRHPAIASDKAGNWVCVWESTGAPASANGFDAEILCSRSSDNGLTWSAPQTLNSNATLDGVLNDRRPTVRTDGAGNWITAWHTEYPLDGDLVNDFDIAASTSVDGGATWSPMTLVNIEAGSSATSDIDVSLAHNGDGTWMAAWSHSVLNKSYLTARSTDNGLTWSATVGPTLSTSGYDVRYGVPRVTHTGDKWLVAMWTYRLFLLDPTITGVETFTSTSGTSWTLTRRVNSGASFGLDSGAGETLLTFNNRVSYSLDSGTNWSAPAIIDGDAPTDLNPSGQWPAVATDGAGVWVSVWDSLNGDGDRVTLIARSTNAGFSWSSAIELANFGQYPLSAADILPDVANDGAGNWVAVWQGQTAFDASTAEDYDILVSRSTDNGQTWSPAALLSDYGASDADETADDATPQIAMDSAGNAVVIWVSKFNLAENGTDGDIFISRSADAGESWTAPALLIPAPEVDYVDSLPALTHNGDGVWLAAWHLGSGDTELFVSQSVDLGATWTLPVFLNSGAADDGSGIADDTVAIASGGPDSWLALWQSELNIDSLIGGDLDIHFARSADGLNWSTATYLNDTALVDASQDDLTPSLASDGAGHWVAVWQSEYNLGGLVGSDNDIFVSTSADDGLTWSKTAPLNAAATIDGVASDEVPVVRYDASGLWVCAWKSNYKPAGYNGTDYDLLAAYSTDHGGSWSMPVFLNTNVQTDRFASDDRPRLSSDGNGNWVAVWNSSAELIPVGAEDNDILATRFTIADGLAATGITADVPGPTSATAVTFTVTFTGPVTTCPASAFALTTVVGDATGVTGTPTGAGDTWTVPVTGITGQGAIRLDLVNGSLIGNGLGGTVGNTLAGGNSAITYIDSLAPAAPLIDLDTESDTGLASDDNLTNDFTPTLGGTAEVGAVVTVVSDITGPLGTATADLRGVWTLTTGELQDGAHLLSATATDAAGNVGPAAELGITIDTVPPVAYTPDLDPLSDTGDSDSDDITAATTLTFNAPREDDSSIELFSDQPGGDFVNARVPIGTGDWSSTVADVRSSATHQFTAQATDRAGNVGEPSAPLTVVIENVPPYVLGVNVLSPQVVRVVFSEPVSTGSDLPANYVFSDTGIGTLALNPASVAAPSSFERDLTVAGEMLTGGHIGVTVSNVEDETGLVIGTPNKRICYFCSQGIAPFVQSITALDPGPTNAEFINYLVIFNEPVTGLVKASFTATKTTGTVNQTISTLTGAGDTWTVSVQIKANSSGTAVLNFNRPADVKDATGNPGLEKFLEGGATLVDNVKPATPLLALHPDDDTGSSNVDGHTYVNIPRLVGSAEKSALVTLSLAGSDVIGSVPADENGTWLYQLPELEDGVYSYTATATDVTGNVSNVSSTFTVTIDTVAPEAPGAPDLDPASDTGESSTDDLTDINTPLFRGVALTSIDVTLRSDIAGDIGTAISDELGNWEIVSAPLENGVHLITAVASDLAGNESEPSPELAVTIDVPVIPEGEGEGGEGEGEGAEGEGEGAEGEGEGAEGEGEGDAPTYVGDTDGDGKIGLAELLRFIQLYNAGAYTCAPETTEDGYLAGSEGVPVGTGECIAHDLDYIDQDGILTLSEVLRGIQFYNINAILVFTGEGDDGWGFLIETP